MCARSRIASVASALTAVTTAPAVGQRVGRREAADAQACHQDPQAGPVGVAVGQARVAGGLVGIAAVPAGVRAAHPAPTTHSA